MGEDERGFDNVIDPVVPSNHWRALEVVRAAEARGPPEATELRAAYELIWQPDLSTHERYGGYIQTHD